MVGRGIGFVGARHECAAVSMADAYGRVSGRVGVATVHQGPGLTNATTALAEAAKARTPLLLLAADTSAGAVRSNFRVDQAGLAAAVGAVAERAHSPASAIDDLARAWGRAVGERRAVLFSLPLDVQAAEEPQVELTPPESRIPLPPTPKRCVGSRTCWRRPGPLSSWPAGAQSCRRRGRRWRAWDSGSER